MDEVRRQQTFRDRDRLRTVVHVDLRRAAVRILAIGETPHFFEARSCAPLILGIDKDMEVLSQPGGEKNGEVRSQARTR